MAGTKTKANVTADELAVDGEKLAPVSGCRCRGCGANATRRDKAEEWRIVCAAAYCPACTKEKAWEG